MLSDGGRRLSILRPPPAAVVAGQENDTFHLIFRGRVWYIIFTMVQRAPAFGFYFGWYFTT